MGGISIRGRRYFSPPRVNLSPRPISHPRGEHGHDGGGIGLARSLGPGDLVLDARGAYGLRDLQTDPKNGKNATGSFVVAVGYDLRL